MDPSELAYLSAILRLDQNAAEEAKLISGLIREIYFDRTDGRSWESLLDDFRAGFWGEENGPDITSPAYRSWTRGISLFTALQVWESCQRDPEGNRALMEGRRREIDAEEAV